jgi:hexosaminidase
VKTTWGGFPDIYCPTEPTFNFIEDVLSEVIDLFPHSPYLHIGGDEVMAEHWKESSFVQELKQREDLKSEKDIHAWFIRRIENFVNLRGKRIIGWDEILGEGVGPSVTIMSWRGFEPGIEAARARHNVIMTPSNITYFDHPQGDPSFEPLSLGDQITLEDVYRFDPVPRELNFEEARHIIGAQGCVWTEFIKRPQDIEYMAFPRALALAEVLWSKQRIKKFTEFSKRLYKEFPRLDRKNVNYRIPKPYGLANRNLSIGEKAIVDLLSPIPNGKIYYTLDKTNPHIGSVLYRGPINLNIGSNEIVELRVKVINSNGRGSSIFIAKYARKP